MRFQPASRSLLPFYYLHGPIGWATESYERPTNEGATMKESVKSPCAWQPVIKKGGTPLHSPLYGIKPFRIISLFLSRRPQVKWSFVIHAALFGDDHEIINAFSRIAQIEICAFGVWITSFRTPFAVAQVAAIAAYR